MEKLCMLNNIAKKCPNNKKVVPITKGSRTTIDLPT